MRLTCPHCGDRDHGEFRYRGDAAPVRPDPGGADAPVAFHGYVHLRDNPAGWIREWWYHEGGCHAWFVVERHTVSHEIRTGVVAAQEGESP